MRRRPPQLRGGFVNFRGTWHQSKNKWQTDISPAGELQTLPASRVALVVIESRGGSARHRTHPRSGPGPTGPELGRFPVDVTEGLLRIDVDLGGARRRWRTRALLQAHPRHAHGRHLRAARFPPVLDNPFYVRTIKDIAQDYEKCARTLVLISHEVKLPQELEHWRRASRCACPTDERHAIVMRMAHEWARRRAACRRST